MSLFSWLSPKKKLGKAVLPTESSGLPSMDATRPVTPGRGGPARTAHPAGNVQSADRKSERMARRELLYVVVREAMVRAGVVSASYKFKVLSLDARGRQFLVMVDLAHGHGGETDRLAEIEALIAQSARSRYDIRVTAVYWRMHEHVAVGLPGARPFRATPSQPIPLDSLPAGLDPEPADLELRPAPLLPQPAPGGPRSTSPAFAAPLRASSRYEPIEADEVEAFKRALAAGSASLVAAAVPLDPAGGLAGASMASGASAKSFDGAGVHGPRSYTLLTGYEDTELPDSDVRAPALSGTQYGDLN